jgi:hypothetical protein
MRNRDLKGLSFIIDVALGKKNNVKDFEGLTYAFNQNQRIQYVYNFQAYLSL